MDLWRTVKDQLTRKEWGKACGTSRAFWSLRWPLLAAQVHNTPGNNGHDLMRQLQLDRWPAFQSLRHNLWHLHEAVKLTPDQSAELDLASNALPLLHCLHIIGRDQVPLTHSSAEGVLVRLLARHALVLTLQVKTVAMPLDLPTLQHLVLNLDADPTGQGHRQTHCALFPALSMLKGLQTLFIQSHRTTTSGTPTIKNATDLTACVHLQYVVLQDVRHEGMIVLPAGCFLHVVSERTYLRENTVGIERLVTGLTLRQASLLKLDQLYSFDFKTMRLLYCNLGIVNLRQLRVNLTRENFANQHKEKGELHVNIGPGMPKLEVVELNIHHDLAIFLNFSRELTSLVVIAAGSLQVHLPNVYRSTSWMSTQARNTTKMLYLQSCAALSPRYKSGLKRYYARHPHSALRLLDYIKEGHNGWTAQKPSSFHPGNVQHCCCNACPECLAHAGVPVVCDEAWTHNGISRHLRQH